MKSKYESGHLVMLPICSYGFRPTMRHFMHPLHDIRAYDYELPEKLIAQYPLEKRDASRLLIVEDEMQHQSFSQLLDHLNENDLIVFNDTQVLKARLFGQKETGGKVEVFVIRTAGHEGTAFIKASKGPKPGSQIVILPNELNEQAEDVPASVQIESQNADGTYEVSYSGDWLALFKARGHLPLPPYMNREAKASDDNRYQTLWAQKPGAVAAPTASLHFSEQLLADLKAKGVETGYLTLHVGAGTFLPVRVNDIREHQMHEEYYEVGQELIDKIKATKAKGGRIISVGTTVLRTLETIGRGKTIEQLEAESGNTSIFIYPGFEFSVVDLLVTNFHLPKSTLLMLVSAFAGKQLIEKAYATAVEQEYRFFSYGDAMLLTRAPK